ncbi:diadenylate cyclase CdaA [Geomesophilobacter sediminis]|uniref:Diadenylate cyclase n=1 Tax=Geomesophilobacter sediminis TaxID=2798584 RepID=A0A8J7JME2_9BACT|nr:diadenylate cyclase CdaA [Geomesophilobacter sediminis]MBJ6725895.1 TIGR00159 family protein [Geomesophilobacter sediminis]
MLPHFRPQDIADILIMTVLVYQLYIWFKNTRALQVMMGLLLLGLVYIVTKNLGLFMTSWILQELGTVLLVLLIVVFQTEIRQALYRLSLLRNFFDREDGGVRVDLLEFSSTIFSLASTRTGALVAFQREEVLDEYVLHGVPVDAVVSGELLKSIFHVNSPLHDGAVLIRDGRVSLASGHLPLSVNPDVPQQFGTRHRAGLGLTERSDAAVVIVSEERGEVSLSVGGELERVGSPAELHEKLNALLAPLEREANRPSLTSRLLSNFWPKLVVFVLVVACWLLVTLRQGEILTVTAPIRFHNLPDSLLLTRSSPDEIDLQLKTYSNLVSSPKDLDVLVDLDLSKIHEGANSVAIRKEDVRLPPGVVVAGMDHWTVRVVAERKARKTPGPAGR